MNKHRNSTLFRAITKLMAVLIFFMNVPVAWAEYCYYCGNDPCSCGICNVCWSEPCTCGDDDETHYCVDCGCEPCACNEDDDNCTEEPIDTASGNNFFTERRLYVPCPGIPLVLGLKYQSITTQPDGLMGKGWLHSYEWFLNVESTKATVYTGTGAKYAFHKNTDGTYKSPDACNWTLEDRLTNRVVRVLPSDLEYHFATDGALEAIQDAWGNRVNLFYNTNNCLERVSHSNGRQLLFQNEWVSGIADWRVGEISVDGGASLEFSYNGDGQFTQVVEKVGAELYSSEYAYGDGFLTNRVDAGGQVYAYGYEANYNGVLTGRGTSLEVDGYYPHTVNYVHPTRTDVIYSTRGLNQCYRYERNSENKLQTCYGPALSVTNNQVGVRYEYAANQTDTTKEQRFDGAETFTTWMQYDAAHNVTNLAIGLNTEVPQQQLAMQYDPQWQLPSFIADADNGRTEILYTNALPASVKAFLSETNFHETSFAYRFDGQIQALTNANGHSIGFTYNTQGDLETVAAEVGPKFKQTCNALGYPERTEILSESGASTGRITEYEVDAKGRARRITHPDGLFETFGHDPLGNVTNATDRIGRVSEFDYAPTRKLSAYTRYLLENGSNIPVRISFDRDEQLNTLAITEPRGRYVESYQLDIQDRITSVTNIEGQVMSVVYGIGNFAKNIVRFDGSSITNTFDLAGRMTNQVFRTAGGAPSAMIDYSYYPDSQLKKVDDASSFVAYEYNRLNRLTNQVVSVSSVYSVVNNHQYDAVGNITNTIVLTADGADIADLSYAYDAAERLTDIFYHGGSETQRFVYVYNPENGRVASVSNSVSGMVCEYEYDLMDRATNVVYLSEQT